MLSHDKVLNLIGRIYDAANDPDLWPAFLEQYADVVNSTVTAVLFYDWSVPGSVRIIPIRYDPQFGRLYREYYNRVNPWLRGWKTRVNLDGPESVRVSEEWLDLAELKKTEFYNDYLRPQDTPHQMGSILQKAEQTCSAFTCLRPRRVGAFGTSEVELLRVLLPHLQRGVRFYQRMLALQGEYRATLDALDRLPQGVILVDDHGRVVCTNSAARGILGQNDGLTVCKEGLAAATADETRALRTLIAGAALAMGQGVSGGGSMEIFRPSGKRPLRVFVTPVKAQTFPAEGRTTAAIAFVSDPEARTQTAPEILARAYNLTGAECRLAEHLLQGESLVCAAEQLGISHNTARTHLQRIYQKTDTVHQGELIRLLLTSVINLLPASRTAQRQLG